MSRNLFIFIIIGTLLIIVALVVTNISTSKITQTPTISFEERTLHGTYVCLPTSDPSKARTLECAFGLMTKDGKYYALDTSGVLPSELERINTQDQIVADGLYTSLENLASKRWDKYNINGLLEIKTIEKDKTVN